jgi:hypothetical protein
LLVLLFTFTAAAQERDMARINWMEFRELVPSKIRTVLLPTGTLEPHGVANNGADITAPEAIARDLAPRLNAIDGLHHRGLVPPVHPERYSDKLATAYPAPNTWSAVPFPSSIGLYQPGQGYPKFDQKKADEYFRKVNDKVFALVRDTIAKWDEAGV